MEKVIETYQEERFNDCLDLVNSLIYKEGKNFERLSYKATSLLKLKRYRESIDVFNECIVLDNDRFFIWVLRGDAFYESGDYERAFSDYWVSLQLEPDNGAAIDKMSRSLFLLGNEDQALAYIERTVNIGHSPEPILIMMAMLNKMGAYGFLHKIYDLGVEKFPDKREDFERYKSLDLFTRLT